MNNSEALTTRFRELYLDGKWIANTNYKEAITAIDFPEATKQIGSLNTIAMLTFHITYYIKGLIEVFDGGELTIQDKFSFSCPPISSQEEWNNLRNELILHAEIIATQIEGFSEGQLKEVFVKEAYGTYERNIEALIEHGYYHLGQISLIKKLIKEGI